MFFDTFLPQSRLPSSFTTTTTQLIMISTAVYEEGKRATPNYMILNDIKRSEKRNILRVNRWTTQEDSHTSRLLCHHQCLMYYYCKIKTYFVEYLDENQHHHRRPLLTVAIDQIKLWGSVVRDDDDKQTNNNSNETKKRKIDKVKQMIERCFLLLKK